MGAITDAIQSLPPAAAYAIIFALVFGEAALFIGFVLPGETAVVLGGFLASGGHLDIVLLCALVFVAAVTGDSVGFEVGKKFGPRILMFKPVRRHHAMLDRAQRMLRERGGPAVFLGRFTAFFRAVMPGLAGVSRMPYRTFLPWNALGGFTWGVGFCLLGYFAGNSYERVAKQVGEGAAIVVGVIIVTALIVWRVRVRRADKAREREWEQSTQKYQIPRDIAPGTVGIFRREQSQEPTVYVEEEHHHSIKLAHVLIACIVVSFALAAINIAYAAGRQSGTDPAHVEVAPAASLHP